MNQCDHRPATSRRIASCHTLLKVWRLMRHEVALQSYTQQNLVAQSSHTRIQRSILDSLQAVYRSSCLPHAARFTNLQLFAAAVRRRSRHVHAAAAGANEFGAAQLRARQAVWHSIWLVASDDSDLTTADELIRGCQFRVESMLLPLSGHLGYCAPRWRRIRSFR